MTKTMKATAIGQTLALFALGCWLMHWHAYSRWEYIAAAFLGAQATWVATRTFGMPFWLDHKLDGYDVGVWTFLILCWIR